MNPPGRQCLPPRYFCLKDRDAFLRELGNYPTTSIDNQPVAMSRASPRTWPRHDVARNREL